MSDGRIELVCIIGRPSESELLYSSSRIRLNVLYRNLSWQRCCSHVSTICGVTRLNTDTYGAGTTQTLSSRGQRRQIPENELYQNTVRILDAWQRSRWHDETVQTVTALLCVTWGIIFMMLFTLTALELTDVSHIDSAITHEHLQ